MIKRFLVVFTVALLLVLNLNGCSAEEEIMALIGDKPKEHQVIDTSNVLTGFDVQCKLQEKYNLEDLAGHYVPIATDISILEEAAQEVVKCTSHSIVTLIVPEEDYMNYYPTLVEYLNNLNAGKQAKAFLVDYKDIQENSQNYKFIYLSNNYTKAYDATMDELCGIMSSTPEEILSLNPNISNVSNINGIVYLK